MSHFVKWISGLLFHNFGWKLLSLAVAFVIWALVASEPELATFATVRVEYKNLSDQLEIGSEPVETVVHELRGPSGELRGETVKPAVILDAAGVTPGQRTFTIGNGNVRLPRGVHLVRAIPSEVRLMFEPRAEREVPVQARFTGVSPPPGRFHVIPRTVRIEGPRSRVSRIAAAVTDPVDAAGLTAIKEFRVNVILEDPYVRLKSPQQATVEVTPGK
jgi:YbbR-like protein